MLHTRIIIRHATVDALKSSELWAQVMALPFADDGPVSIVEIARADNPDTADDIAAPQHSLEANEEKV